MTILFLFINKVNIIDFVEVCSDSVLSTFSKDLDQFLFRVLKIKYLLIEISHDNNYKRL